MGDSAGLNGGLRIAIIAAIVVLSLAGAASVVVLTVTGLESRSTPAMATLLAFLAPTIGVLVNLLLTGQVRRNQVVLNGEVAKLHEHLAHATSEVKGAADVAHEAADTAASVVEKLPEP